MYELGVAVEDVEAVEAAMARLCEALDPESVPLSDVAAVYGSLCRIRKLIVGAETRLARRLDESQAWVGQGDRSAADFIARSGGCSKSAAREQLGTSQRLKSLAETDEAVRNGQLSDAQAAAISDAATADPGSESRLLGASKSKGLGELRDECRRTKAKADPDPDATYRRLRSQRRLRRWNDGEGAYNLSLRATPDAGARIDAQLQPVIDRLFGHARRWGDREPTEAYAADALVELITGCDDLATTDTPTNDDTRNCADGDSRVSDEPRGDTTGSATAGGATEGEATEGGAAGGDATDDDLDAAAGGGPGGRSPVSRSRRASRARESKIIALVDYHALRRGHAEAGETCEIVGVGPVPASTVQAMVADAFLSVVVTDGVDVYNVAHHGRQVTAHQRTALEVRGYRCEVPGCDVRHNLEIDHITGWTVNYRTKLDDLCWLCHHHHYLKTHCGYRLLGEPGSRRWQTPAGVIASAEHHPSDTTPAAASAVSNHDPPDTGPPVAEPTLFDPEAA